MGEDRLTTTKYASGTSCLTQMQCFPQMPSVLLCSGCQWLPKLICLGTHFQVLICSDGRRKMKYIWNRWKRVQLRSGKKNYCKKGVSEIRRCCTFVIPINHISFSVLVTSLHVTVMERYIPRMFVEGVVPTPLTLSTCKVSLRASPELLSRIRFSTTLYFVWACENPHKQEHWHLFWNQVQQLVNCLITQYSI